MDHTTLLRTEVERFQAALDDLDLSVPACPGWRVRDVLHHVSAVHRRFRRVADEGWMTRPPDPDPDDQPSADDDRLVAWAAAEAGRLIDALERLDPGAPRWNFTASPQVGAFIPRRMLHETAVHRWDLDDARGEADGLEVEVARDGVSEYLEVLLSRPGAWTGDRLAIRVDLVDPGHDDRSFHVQLEPGALPTAGPPNGESTSADVLVRGDATSMLLAWWGRRSLAPLVTEGEADALDAVLAYAPR